MINIGVTVVELLLVTPQTITHMEKLMKNLVNKLKECDGAFCEQIAISGFAVAVLAIMTLSIAQI